MNSFICYCNSGFTGSTCSQLLPLSISNQKDYSYLISQIEITSQVFDSIKTIGDIVSGINPVVGSMFNVLSGLIGLFSGMPSFNEVLYEYLQENFKMINEKLNSIYNQIIDINNKLAKYYTEISRDILNLQFVLTAVSNINKMNVYASEASNMIIDLSVYFDLDIIDFHQIQQTCGQNYNPQHYLNIINQYASASIFDSSLGSSYNLVYNIMIINNYSDYPTYSAWYKKMLLLAYNLAYYGQVCDSANNKSLRFQNQSTILRAKTFSNISTGFTNQINELTTMTYFGQFIGCFVDNLNSRDLPNMPYKDVNNAMNVGFCINYCQSLGYLYAGLQNGYSSYKLIKIMYFF